MTISNNVSFLWKHIWGLNNCVGNVLIRGCNDLRHTKNGQTTNTFIMFGERKRINKITL